MKIIGKYINGNTDVVILEDGTKIRKTEDDEFVADFADNIDIKICNKCDMNCQFCHEGSTKDGKLGDILNENFVDSLKPYQEVALGGGNVLEHPDLIEFLRKLKDKKVIPNVTLHQYHFEKEFEFVKKLINEKLIYGLGISVVNPTDEFLEKIKISPNIVLHTINGIFNEDMYNKLKNNDIKLLILGYKKLRRGEVYIKAENDLITKNQKWLEKNIMNILDDFKVISFDNLSIEQLNIKNKVSEEVWDNFYSGDDGTHTFYIDMVERKFAQSSTAPFDKRYNLLDDVVDMFKVVKATRR